MTETNRESNDNLNRIQCQRGTIKNVIQGGNKSECAYCCRSLTSKFSASCQKGSGFGYFAEKEGRQRDRVSVITLIIVSLGAVAEQIERAKNATPCEQKLSSA